MSSDHRTFASVPGTLALRLGLRQIGGFRKEWAEALVKARLDGPVISLEDVARRAGLPSRALHLLADADALGSLGRNRREAGWEARRVPPVQLPLFAACEVPELGHEPEAALPAMTPSEEVVADYQTQRLSLKGHPMQFLRDTLSARGVLDCATINAARDGAKVRAAGVVLIRQRPGKGNAIFITIEDETGIVNALIWARDLERQRRAVMGARLMLIEGTAQRSKEDVVHLIVDNVTDASNMLDMLTDTVRMPDRPARAQTKLGVPLKSDEARHPTDAHPPRSGARRHPRDVRILPKSRDFH